MRRASQAVSTCVIAALALPLAAAARNAKVLAPHRAVYEITLDRSRGGSGVSDMSGRMVYELKGSECEGYTQTMRFVTRMTNQEAIDRRDRYALIQHRGCVCPEFPLQLEPVQGFQAVGVDRRRCGPQRTIG